MAVTLVGTGGIFTRIGLIGGMITSLNTYRGTTLPTKVDTFSNEYNLDKDFIDSLYSNLASWNGANSGFPSFLRQAAEKTVVDMVMADNPQPNAVAFDCLKELARQMIASSDSIKRSVPAGTATAASGNTGNGKCVVGISQISDVKVRGVSSPNRENIFAEDIIVTCDADSYDQGATAGQESFSAEGEFPQSDTLASDWPRGSGGAAALLCADASLDATTGNNLLTNSSFEAFTTNAPNNWAIATGTAGTTIASTATVFAGTKALTFIGNGSELTEIRQTFDDATGTAGTLSPQTIYAVCVWMRKSASLLAGTVRFALTATDGTPLNDDLNQQLSFSVAAGSLTTSYAPFTGVFVTPRVKGSVTKFAIKATTALTNGELIYIDHLALATATEVYTGGPLLRVFSGSVPFTLGDKFTVAMTNTRGVFQTLFDKLFGMRELDLILPSAASNTISDSLVA